MIVRRFLLWARTAPAAARAQGAAALAGAYLRSAMSPEDRREAETALIALVDDPRYAIQLANEDSWDPATGDNVLTRTLRIDPAATGPIDASATQFVAL